MVFTDFQQGLNKFLFPRLSGSPQNDGVQKPTVHLDIGALGIIGIQKHPPDQRLRVRMLAERDVAIDSGHIQITVQRAEFHGLVRDSFHPGADFSRFILVKPQPAGKCADGIRQVGQPFPLASLKHSGCQPPGVFHIARA